MASLPPSGGRPSLTPLSMFYPRRATSSENPYAPSTSSPLSPHSTSLPPLETSTATTNSHYYRPPRSGLTSPARSAISSSTHSPTRASRQFRVQSLLATDPLLCHLTPVTINRLSTSGDFDFEPGEKEWSLRAAEGTIKVNEWLREVEGWNREWRRTYRESKDAGDGYLPPADRPEKRRKIGMGSIREEEEGAMLDGSKPVRRRLFSEDNGTGGSGGVIVKDDTPEVGAVESPKPQTDSPSLRRGGKPLTPYQLKMQRQRAAEVENGPTPVDGRLEPDQILVKPVEKIGAKEGREEEEEEEEEEEDDQDDELEEGVEYWGSLKRSVVEGYEARIEVIKSEIEELDVDGLKDRVLSYRASAADLLTDSSAIMAATTLQLLPPLSRLTKLLSIWAVRIAVLRIVPVFLRWLQIAKDALEAGYTAITHPSINPESSSLDKDWRGLEEESYTLMQETITQKVATAGMLMDTMLDALEGREDVLPEKWIAELEEVEEGVGRWEMDGERVVLEGRLRLEEMIICQSRKEEEAREREKTLLVLEQERSAQEARAEEEAAMEVMEKAEETDKRLREALETSDIVAEAMNLPDDGENDWIELDSNPKDLEELFSKLEGVEKERSLSGEDEDRGRRPKRAGSVDLVPLPNGVGNHLDPPEPPTASALLVVEEDQNEFPSVEEESGLPTATNGTFFSHLFSAIPQTPLRKTKQTSEEARPLPVAAPSSGTSEKPASETAVNVSAILPGETASPQLPQQQQDEDERIQRTISQQMEQNLSQGQSAWSEPRTASSLAHTEEKPEEEDEKKEKQSEEVEKEEDGEKGEGEDEDELQGTFADDEAIRLKLVQQMEQMMIGNSNQSQRVGTGVISATSVPELAPTVEQQQSQPQISSALPTEDDERIRQRITRDMERFLAGTSASQLVRKEEVGSSQPTIASQSTPSTVLSSLTAAAPQQSQFPTEDEEVQSRSTESVVQPEIQREGQQISPLASVQPVDVPVVGAIPAQRSQAQVNTPQDDEAIRYKIQQEMRRLLESGGTLSTSTAVVAVDEPIESTEEPAEEKSPFSTPPRSVRHPSPPIIGDDDQIRRKIVTEMEQFVNNEHAPRAAHVPRAAASSSRSTDQEPQQRILQPEPRPITAPVGDNEDEQIRQQIIRQMENMLIHDAAPAVSEPALQGPASHVAEVMEQTLPVSYPTAAQAVPAPQVISSDDEGIRRKVVGEMETLLRGGSILQQPQLATVPSAIPVQRTIAQPSRVSVQPTSSETLADDEKIKQKIIAEMEESLQKERPQEGESDQSGAQQAALHAESEKRVDEKREAEAERHQPAPEQAEREGITKLAEAEEKTLEAEACKVAELRARRLAEEEELAEKARLELEAEKVAEAKRLLLAEEATQKEKAAELERLAEAERQRLDAQRHEEESAAAKALEERRAIEAERAAVVEAARQVFVREQTGFDDKKFQELDRQRRLAEDERVRLADVALAEREKAREARQQREREIEEERVKAETSVFSSPTGLGETVEEGMLPIELSEKVAKREISRDPTRATSASKNRSVAPRSSTPTLGKVLAKDQKQRFTLGSGSSAPSAAAGYKRPTSRAEARPSSRQGNRPSSRAQEFRPPSRASDTKTARPSSRAGPSTPGGPGDDGSNSSTPTGTPAPAIRPMRRLRRDTVSTTGADSDDGDDPRRFFRENTPEMNNSDFAKAPKLQVTKRHARQPSNFTSIVTPEKSSRFNKSPYVAEGSSLVLPTTPILQVDLDDRINEILGSLPSKVHLTASNLQKLSESTKRLPPIKPLDLSPTGIPGPKSVETSSSIASEVPSYARASARRHNLSSPGDIKLYHLHRTDGQAPIKLYIRLVGENGERVMVRVGGGWADLAEYLKEYVAHHGSKKRVVSEGRVEIQDLSTHSHHGRTLHPSRSISSFRSASPGSMGSRPSSPLPGGNRPSTSFSMRRPESPVLMKRSESENPSLHTNPTTMRGGHNGTLPENNKTSPTTPSDEVFPLQPVTAIQLTPPNRNSPPSRPASRPGSSSSAGYRRPTSRLSFSESAFDDCGSINEHSSPSHLPPPQPLGLAGPRGKYVHPENQAWVEGVLGQVRKASADRRAQLLAAAAGHYGEGGVEEVVVEGSMAIGGGGQGGDYSGREFGGRLGEIGKVGGTRRLFAKKG